MVLRKKIIIASLVVSLVSLVLVPIGLLFIPIVGASFLCSSGSALVSLLPFKKLSTTVDGTKFSIKYPYRLTARSFLNPGNISFSNTSCWDSGAAFSIIFLPKQALIPGEPASGDNRSLMQSYVAHMRRVTERQLQRRSYTAELAEKTYGANTFYVFTESYEEPIPFEGMNHTTNQEFFKFLDDGRVMKIDAFVGSKGYLITTDELNATLKSISLST